MTTPSDNRSPQDQIEVLNLDILYRDFAPSLLRYARMLNPNQADDLVHEAFAALADRPHTLPPVTNPRGYLVTLFATTLPNPNNLGFHLG